MGRYLDMWSEKIVEVNLAEGLAERLRRSRRQVGKAEAEAAQEVVEVLPAESGDLSLHL